MNPDYFSEGVREFEARWIGWAGVNVPDEVGQKALTKALAEKVCKFCLLLVLGVLRGYSSAMILDYGNGV